jgi:hypothetical protein
VMEAPKLRAVFRAAEHGSDTGMWTPDSVAAALDGQFDGKGSGFASEASLVLADETIGFSQ